MKNDTYFHQASAATRAIEVMASNIKFYRAVMSEQDRIDTRNAITEMRQVVLRNRKKIEDNLLEDELQAGIYIKYIDAILGECERWEGEE